MVIDEGRRTANGGTAAGLESSVLILPALLRDLFAIRALEQTCFGPDGWGYMEILLALVMPGNVRFKAVADNRLVGLAIGEPRPFEDAAWIETIGVLPEYQRRSIGTGLLAACETALPQPVIKLTVRVSNHPAIALYGKQGYKRVDLWKRYYEDGEDAIVMEKRK